MSNFLVACRNLNEIKGDFENFISDADLNAEEVIQRNFMFKISKVETLYYILPGEEKNNGSVVPQSIVNTILPKLNLHHFSGEDIKEFPTFMHMYDSLVHNE